MRKEKVKLKKTEEKVDVVFITNGRERDTIIVLVSNHTIIANQTR